MIPYLLAFMSEAPQPTAPVQQQHPTRKAILGGAAGSLLATFVLALVLQLAKVLGKLSTFEILAYVALPACVIGVLVSFVLLMRNWQKLDLLQAEQVLLQKEYTDKVSLLLAKGVDEHEARLAALEEKAGLKPKT